MDAEQPEIVLLRLGEFDDHGTTRGRLRSRVIEVEHGIPGELVRVEIMGGRRPRGRIVDILAPATDRTTPPCRFFHEWKCGGCQWQHIDGAGQLARKQEAVEVAVRRAGLDLVVNAVHALDDPWRYRTTAGIALGKRAGFRRHASLAIVPIDDCLISHPLIGGLMAGLNERILSGELLDFRGRVRLDVRIVQDSDEPALQVLIVPDPHHPLEREAVSTLSQTLWEMPHVGSVLGHDAGGSLEALHGERFGYAAVAGRQVTVSVAAFFQTNVSLLPVLIRRIEEEASPLTGKRVADIYGGIGIFGLFLSEQAAEVTIIDSNPVALEAAGRTVREWGLSNVRFVVGRAEEVLEETERYDVVIVDPPRSGLSPPVIAELLRGRPPLLLYVSCLAQSLARDLLALTAAGYTVDTLELFDFYPQTYHVEMLAVLRREIEVHL